MKVNVSQLLKTTRIPVRVKRMAKSPATPASGLPERRKRPTVTASLIASVEKLKLSGRPVVGRATPTASACVSSDDTGRPTPRSTGSRICLFPAEKREDHSYSKSVTVGSEVENETVIGAEKILSDEPTSDFTIKKMVKSMKELCNKGTSVLTKHTGVPSLLNRNLFADTLVEMANSCPSLLTILKAILCKTQISQESKLATISTIYAMLMHSLNNHVCAIQKLYTSAAIRYHADNKVCCQELSYLTCLYYSIYFLVDFLPFTYMIRIFIHLAIFHFPVLCVLLVARFTCWFKFISR